MSLISPIRRLARHINRVRLAMAESDLAFLEARAPIVIEQQRALVDRRRARAGLPLITADSETIRRQVEQRAKLGTVLS